MRALAEAIGRLKEDPFLVIAGKRPGCVFVGTGLFAHKGAAATAPFPMFIALMGCVQIVLARFAAKRGWVD